MPAASAPVRDPSGRPPSRAARAALALAVAALSAALVLLVSGHARGLNAFDQLWVGARALRDGADPYALVGPGRMLPQKAPNYYPATAMVAVMPLSALPPEAARALFFGVGAGLLAFAATRRDYLRMPMFLSGSFALALLSQQWAPILTAAAMTPALTWVYAVKPNVGLALFAARPTRAGLLWGILGGGLLVAISLRLRPTWPNEWMAISGSAPHIRALVTHPAGPLMLLALTKWRRAEARLLAAMACVPHSTLFYEALPLLFLVPRSREEVRALWLLSWIGTTAATTLVFAPDYDFFRGYVYEVGELMLALLYLPALLMVLRRRNEGEVPEWVERAATRTAAWLRRSRAPEVASR